LITISILAERYAIHRLPPNAALPAWATAKHAEFITISRTEDELSILLPQDLGPAGEGEGGWRGLKLLGPFPLDAIGILAGISAVLAQSRVSILAVSTFETDYVFVREKQLSDAVTALRSAGYEVDKRLGS
jgi:hypothetical protein